MITNSFHRRVFCYKLQADARRFLLRYFVAVATQSEEFLHLQLDELNSIILEDELNVKSEEVVWEAVLRWVNYEPDLRWQHTVKLMGSIRLGLLDTQVDFFYQFCNAFKILTFSILGKCRACFSLFTVLLGKCKRSPLRYW